MYSLIIRSPGYPPQKVRLVRPQNTIGRSVRADIAIPDSFASRLHARLRAEENGYILEDLQSANGTYYNGMRVSVPIRLKPGDIIRIGETDLEFASDTIHSVSNLSRTAVFLADSMPATAPEATIGMAGFWATDEILGRASGPLGGKTSVVAPKMPTSASAIEVSGPPTDPKRRLLALVSKVGVALLSNSDLDEVLDQVMNIVFESLPVERGYLMMSNENQSEPMAAGSLICKVARVGGKAISGEVTLSRHITEQVLVARTAVLTLNAQQDPRFAGQQSIVLSGTRSVMAVPLALGDQVHGLIYVENPYEQRFTPDDLEVLTTIASVAVIKIENARLLEERLEKQRLEEEVALAGRIQASMLPRCDPELPGFELAGLSRPAAGVSGDYYDYIRISDSHLAVVIGDVTGHGISSGLLMALAKGGLLNQVIISSKAEDVMAAMNTLIYENGSRRDLMTFCYLLVNLYTGEISLSNAGHPFPYWFQSPTRTVHSIEIGAYPLGAKAMAVYPAQTLTMSIGDVIVIYSDGIVELQNTRKEQLGYQRFETMIRDIAHKPAREICEGLVESALKFSAGCLPEDDITVVVLKRRPPLVR
ncbi:MAG TPA: SpoIIE family protein phosphatase [Acidobacteriota bacterium]|nr:SpoIIE family protein phosphatase [Acidobacteriota bacterium]